jgi:hypothetical protein
MCYEKKVKVNPISAGLIVINLYTGQLQSSQSGYQTHARVQNNLWSLVTNKKKVMIDRRRTWATIIFKKKDILYS